MKRPITFLIFCISLVLLVPAYPAAAVEAVIVMYDIVTTKDTSSYLDIVSKENWRLTGKSDKSNIQVLKEAADFEILEDWLCPQVERVDVDMRGQTALIGAAFVDHWRYQGKLYKRIGARHACKDWTGPSVRTDATAGSIDVLAFPPGLSGIMAECLKEAGVTGDKGKTDYAPGSPESEFYRKFNRDWQDSTRGSSEFQARMLKSGHVYVEGRGWVDGKTLQKEQHACVANQLRAQIVRLSSNLNPEQQQMVRNIAQHIMAEGDPVERLAQLQRLRNGTFLTIAADADRAMSDVHQMEALEIAVDTVTAYAPLLNDSRDFLEFSTGRDAWTGRELAWWERALSGIGIIAGSGQAMRELFSKAGKVADAVHAAKAGKLADKERKLLDEALSGGAGASERLSAGVKNFGAREKAMQAVRDNAARKVDEFAAAVKSRDKARIQKAMAEIQADRQAIMTLNSRPNVIKKKFNDNMQEVYDEVNKKTKERLADHYNRKIAESGKDMRFTPNQAHGVKGKTVRAGDAALGSGIQTHHVTISSVSNPSTRVKAGQDYDFTARIFGQDVPSHEAQAIRDQVMFEVMQAREMLPAGVKTPKELGKKMEQTAVHWLDAEAYSRNSLPVVMNPSEVDLLTGKPLPVIDRRNMADPRQVGMTMSYKAHEEFRMAEKLEALGKLEEAETARMYGMYQIRKQFDNQLLGRVQAARQRGLLDLGRFDIAPDLQRAMDAARKSGNENLLKRLELEAMLPEKLRRKVDILRKVEEGGLSPARAEGVLKEVFGSTPDDVARELGEAMSEWEMRIMSKGMGT